MAALLLLRLYKPRDSSNIGLAQIRLLGTLALPTYGLTTADAGLSPASPVASATSSATPTGRAQQPSLTWLCIVHHCLSIADQADGSDRKRDLLGIELVGFS